jgi:hypothetical protein
MKSACSLKIEAGRLIISKRFFYIPGQSHPKIPAVNRA